MFFAEVPTNMILTPLSLVPAVLRCLGVTVLNLTLFHLLLYYYLICNVIVLILLWMFYEYCEMGDLGARNSFPALGRTKRPSKAA
jgi:hypothetical protein